MVKFLKPNKAVIVLQGRYAGRKAVIIRTFDEGTRERPYGHCLVAGIKKYPSKVIKKDSAKKTAKKSRVKAFVKLVNYQHLMPTRYTLDVDLKDAVTPDVLVSKDKKVTALKETKKRLEDRFKTGKNRCLLPVKSVGRRLIERVSTYYNYVSEYEQHEIYNSTIKEIARGLCQDLSFVKPSILPADNDGLNEGKDVNVIPKNIICQDRVGIVVIEENVDQKVGASPDNHVRISSKNSLVIRILVDGNSGNNQAGAYRILAEDSVMDTLDVHNDHTSPLPNVIVAQDLKVVSKLGLT
ncbi:unnamed protein product [Sphenostylis stenocarpa]|uniref:KOW domain-containing protein n=1 Tax=Sphenostylis stenocarpa TaxID=92480 RepID=A0AA86RYQ9_9FABA|nr:unnamed protein product [Sphenostylis stenocarpa]